MTDLKALLVWQEEEFNGRADEDGEPMFDLVNRCRLFANKNEAELEVAEAMNEDWEPDMFIDIAIIIFNGLKKVEDIPELVTCIYKSSTGNSYLIDTSATIYIQEPNKNPVLWCHQD